MSTLPPVRSPSNEHAQKSRGQQDFVNAPRIGAAVYDRLMADAPLQMQYADVAQDLAGRITQGRLLDVGTGPGRLLVAFHARRPAVKLFGLDISAAMLEQARQNLAGIAVDLRQGNICHTSYPSESFDLVVSTGSFYVWDEPQEGLDEIHRILVRGGSAYLYECRRDVDRRAFRLALRENLRSAALLTKVIGPFALRQALARSYTRAEIAAIIARTSFADSFVIDDVTLAGMPMWMRVELKKAA